MSRIGFHRSFRGAGRNKFPDDDDQIDDETNSIFANGERVVRMAGDTIMAGIKTRVTFKPKMKTFNRNLEFAVHNIMDNDMQMTLNNNKNESSERQVFFRKRGRGNFNGRVGPFPQHDLRQRLTQIVLVDANWYKIIIPCGPNFPKDFIIKSMLDYITPETFVPILYHNQEKSSAFFVDDSQIAKKLLSCDNRIFLNDKFRLHVYVKPGYPQCKIDEVLKQKLTQAIIKRYNQDEKTLDLSRFHRDPDLVDEYFCALFQPFMLRTVLDLAALHVPNLVTLNLESNKLTTIDRLSTLETKFQNLKILHLGDNQLKDISQIDAIKNLKLEELRLSGNPMCNKYSLRHSEYVSDVRQKFPKMLKLDSCELPPPILFDVVEEGLRIPQSKNTFAVDQNTKDIAAQFLQQYFSIFDNGNRQQLLNAYHEKASFSMTVSPNLCVRPTSYLGESRNLLRLNDPVRRRKMLKHGKLSVLSVISEFPQTKHDWDSFTMDVTLCMESMMLVTVTGLYNEINDQEAPFRYFNRVFVIVPEGTGYCILNEQIFIQCPTQLQHKRAMNNLAKLAKESPMNSQDTLFKSPTLSEDMKQKMIITLSNETHMNMTWSLKCLSEVQWNYENALAAFQQFFKQGLVPAEAFQK